MPTPAAIDFEAGWNNAWNSVATVLPNIVVCIVILVVGYLIAKAIEKILDRVLVNVGFDRWVERGGVKRALDGSGLDAAQLLGRVVFYALMLVVLATAFGVFGPNPVTSYLDAAVAYLPKVFVALLIMIIAAAIASGVRTLVSGSLGAVSFGRIAANIAYGLVLALGVTAALNQLEIAPLVVNALLYAVLAALVGVTVVAVGGGGIAPMRQRWENTLSTYDASKRQLNVAAAGTAPAHARPSTDPSLAGSQPPSVDLRGAPQAYRP